MARLTLYTHPSRRGNPYHNKVYPHAYDRIAGLAVDRGIPMWVNDRNVGPSNVYDLAQLDTSEVSVPRWLARRIARYFQAHFAAVTVPNDHYCHHFARAVVLGAECTPNLRSAGLDTSNRAAQTIIGNGVEVSGYLPMGVHGVFGVKRPKGPVGFHSVIGLGDGQPVVQVLALDGNMGLAPVDIVARNVDAIDNGGKGGMRLYALESDLRERRVARLRR